MSKICILGSIKSDNTIFHGLINHDHSLTKIIFSKNISVFEIPPSDLIILNLSQEEDWLNDFLVEFRNSNPTTPILIARGIELSSLDKVAIESGCDAILETPCSQWNILMRIENLLNRSYVILETFYFLEDGIIVNSNSHSIEKDQKSIHIGLHQFKILEFLALHPGQYFTSFQLLERLGLPSDNSSQGSMRMQIMKLRKLLSKLGNNTAIDTKYGEGYSILNVKTKRDKSEKYQDFNSISAN